jgi:hypothetical protein
MHFVELKGNYINVEDIHCVNVDKKNSKVNVVMGGGLPTWQMGLTNPRAVALLAWLNSNSDKVAVDVDDEE